MKSVLLIATALCLWSAPTRVHASSRADRKACVATSKHAETAREEGHFLEARKFLLECARDACPRAVRKRCGAWLGEVDRSTPSVLIRVTDAWEDDVTDASATIDGVPSPLDGRPIALDPGQHVVAVTAPGGGAAGRKFSLAEHEKSRVVSVRLRSPAETRATLPAPPATEPVVVTPASSPRRRFVPPFGAWVLAGVGGAAFTTATIFGVSALRKRRELARTCAPTAGGDGCTDDQMKPAMRRARVTDVSLGIGVASVLGAVAWSVYAFSRTPGADISPSLSLLPTRDGAIASFERGF